MIIRFFRQYIPGSVLLLLMMEVLVFSGSVYVGAILRSAGSEYSSVAFFWHFLPKAMLFAVTMSMSLMLFRLYDYWQWSGGIQYMLPRLGAALTMGFVAMTLIFYLFPDTFMGRGVFAIAYLVSALLVTLLRLIVFRWANLEGLKRRVLILGTGSRAARIGAMFESGTVSHRLKVVGYLPLNGTHHFVDCSLILNDKGRLSKIARQHNVREIVIAIRDRRGGLPLAELLECRLMGIKITELSAFFERETGQLPVESLNAGWIIHADGFENGIARDISKRIFDLCASGLLLVASFPVMLLAAMLIFLESGAPVLYRQERVGQDDCMFTIYKFRSMRLDAEKAGKPQWASANDDRITRVGKVLRKLRIDELPQIFNVFRGDMSFVGPRPERPFFVEKLANEITYYKYRHSVKPGITGWAQVRYAYGASIEDSIEKLQYDLYYVKNHGMFLDFMIMFATVQVVLFGKGAR